MKKRKSQRITNKEKRYWIEFFKEVYDIKVSWYYEEGGALGWYSARNNKEIIRLNKEISGSDVLSTFFHELGHSYCTRNNKYPCYHVYKKRLTKKDKKNKVLTGWRAECYVDKWAEKEMKFWFPSLSYEFAYVGKGKEVKDWYNTYYLNLFR